MLGTPLKHLSKPEYASEWKRRYPIAVQPQQPMMPVPPPLMAGGNPWKAVHDQERRVVKKLIPGYRRFGKKRETNDYMRTHRFLTAKETFESLRQYPNANVT